MFSYDDAVVKQYPGIHAGVDSRDRSGEWAKLAGIGRRVPG